MTSTEIASASKIMLGTTEATAMYIGSTLTWPIQTSAVVPAPIGKKWVPLTSNEITYSTPIYKIAVTENNFTGDVCRIGFSTHKGLSVDTNEPYMDYPARIWYDGQYTNQCQIYYEHQQSIYDRPSYMSGWMPYSSLHTKQSIICNGTIIRDVWVHDCLTGTYSAQGHTDTEGGVPLYFFFQQSNSPIDHFYVMIEDDYSNQYFTIESLFDSNTITAVKNNSTKSPTIYYSLDDGNTWNNQTLSSGTITFGTIDSGDKIVFKSTSREFASDWNQYIKFDGTTRFKVYGNIMSLTNGDDFISNSSFQSGATYVFCGLFYGSTMLMDANGLILPATTLVQSCYNGMFRGCSNLINAPKLLPALDVPQDGYSSMFEGCTNLTSVPEIYATSISGTTALNRMFCMNRNSRVTSRMTESPVLKITNPSAYNNAYQQLFAGNGNITEVTILAQGTNLSFNNWLANTNSSGGVIKKLSGTTLVSGNSGIPSNWTTETYTQS